ncbi:hypothetical protein CSC74_13475 [Pseudoxanthomonas yeongjuensis]|nr:hypothetical protein CSC74_13475 [Pseudoxanthomonas yeongjuensis]
MHVQLAAGSTEEELASMHAKRRLRSRFVLAGLLIAAIAPPAVGSGKTGGDIDRKDQSVMSTRTFLNAHPDLKYRYEGWVAYEAGDYGRAMEHFRTASRYADKASQAMVAEMLWQGRGVPVDRALAYAWADLAAERGYPSFLRLREQYWRQLSEVDRARALHDGQSLLSEYADAVARPRMARFLVKAEQSRKRSSMSIGRPREIRFPAPGGGMASIPVHRFLAPKFWDPVQYQVWQDQIWSAPPRGEVDVGDVEQVAPAKE